MYPNLKVKISESETVLTYPKFYYPDSDPNIVNILFL